MIVSESIDHKCDLFSRLWSDRRDQNSRSSQALVLSGKQRDVVFFSSCVLSNANTFRNNAYLFGKVYFPRLTVPVSQMLEALIRFFIQMSMVLVILGFYCVKGQLHPHFGSWIIILLILIVLGIMGMSVGIIISSMTTKYRDLSILVSFGMNLWMYATPVIYPFSQVPSGWIRTVAVINPVSPMMELFRYALLGVGDILPAACLWSFVFTVITAVVGVVVFNHVERIFMDTV